MTLSRIPAGQVVGVFFWRRIDNPGHDSCRLLRKENGDGWLLSGAAAFREGAKVCQAMYEVHTDAQWRTASASVAGFAGKLPFHLEIGRTADGFWHANGKVNKRTQGCIDLDLSFTPATNLIALRRLSLVVGQQADAPAAYLQFPQLRLTVLPQHYCRTSATTYQYASPSAGYQGILEVAASGEVIRYPGVFERVE
jgi:uncharacterized protein